MPSTGAITGAPAEAAVDPARILAPRLGRLHLDEGEVVILFLRPHWLGVALEPAVLLPALAAAAIDLLAIASFGGLSTAARSTLVVAVFLLLFVPAMRILQALRTAYILTDRRILTHDGPALRMRTSDCPLADVGRVRAAPAGFASRWGVGVVVVSTPGGAVAWRQVADARAVAGVIEDAVARYAPRRKL